MSRRSTKQRRAARKRRAELAADRAQWRRMIIWGALAAVAAPTLSRVFFGGRK